MPAIDMVRLSPDGQKLAWVDYSKDPPEVTVYDLDENRFLKQLRPDTENTIILRDLDWASNQTLLITVSATDIAASIPSARRLQEYFRTLAWDVAGGPARILLLADASNRRWSTGSQLLRIHTGRPDTVVMSTFEYLETAYRMETGSRITGGRKDSGVVYSLFEVDTRTGKGVRIDAGTPFTDEWIVDQHGRPVARSEWNPEKSEFQLIANQRGNWKTLYRASTRDDLRPDSVTADGSAIIAVGSRGGKRVQAWRIPLDGGAITAIADTVEEVEYTIHDRFTGTVTGLQLGGLVPSIHWLDSRLENIQKAISKAFSGRLVQVYDRSEDYSRVLARVEGAGRPPIYYLVDLTKGTADTIGETYPELVEAQLGRRVETSYRARDGIEIPAYLTLPPDAGSGKLPLVVFPHGGPYSRDDSGFDWWAQFMATRGYAVLQPQFRGSVGFGAELTRAGEREWGQAMQDDLTDGIRAMSERGIADSRRVCIVGASYGGYAALAGVALTPEQYSCAVSVNGISDLPAMHWYLRSRYGDESDALAAWKKLVGRPYSDELATHSPSRAIGAIRAPILLIHGSDDIIVPISQSEELAKALRAGGKQHQFVRLEAEDHWLSTGAARLRILEEIERFLRNHLAATRQD